MLAEIARSPGDAVGRYVLVRLLGRGGTGDVWEALLHGPAGFRRPVALKLIRAATDASARASLVREARLGALLHHPHVVSTLDLGWEPGAGASEALGTWFVAMELVRGASLGEVLRRAPLPPACVREVGLQVCAGLAEIHRAGLVHRDLKPGNLLVDRAGVVKIADLGVSAFAGAPSGGSGTPAFMPPEQAEGREDLRADLFALGATLFALSVGRPPFGWGRAAREAGPRVDELLAGGLLRPVEEVAPGLGPVVARCLRRDPDERWPSADALAEALRQFRLRRRGGPTLAEIVRRVVPGAGPEEAATVSRPTEGSEATPRRGNLRAPSDRFVGRADQVASLVEAVLRPVPLVTLHGLGGAGKTRLAIEVAASARGGLPGGAWFFDLSEATTPDGACGAVARGLGTDLGADPAAQVGRALCELGRAVVVLDNLEQLQDHAPELVAQWVTLAPRAVFLCTSRVALRLKTEALVSVGPMDPAEGAELFVARCPRPLGPDEASHVGPIVRSLDGQPLALELAAARARSLPLAELRRRLDDRLRVLAGGDRERPERHRSLRAALDGSLELLSAAGRSALAELSVFEGAFGLEAAEEVLDLAAVPDGRWALDTLQELQDASLLRVDAQAGRFALTKVVQQYAAERLGPDDRSAAEVRHGRHYARATNAALDAAGGTGWHELASDLDNLVAACRRAIARGDGDVAVATALRADSVLTRRGPLSLGIELLEAAAPRAAPTDDLEVRYRLAVALRMVGRAEESARLLGDGLALARARSDARFECMFADGGGFLARELGQLDRAEDLHGLALRIATERGDASAEAAALSNLGNLRLDQADLSGARVAYERALELQRELGQRRGEGITLGNLGIVWMRGDDPATAAERFREALAIHREVGNRRFEGMLLGNLGNAHRSLGRLDDAAAFYAHALEIHREVGNRRSEGIVIESLGALARDRGDPATARARYAEALAVHRETANRRHEVTALADLAELELADAHAERAAEHLRTALEIVAGTGAGALERRIRDRLAEVTAG